MLVEERLVRQLYRDPAEQRRSSTFEPQETCNCHQGLSILIISDYNLKTWKTSSLQVWTSSGAWSNGLIVMRILPHATGAMGNGSWDFLDDFLRWSHPTLKMKSWEAHTYSLRTLGQMWWWTKTWLAFGVFGMVFEKCLGCIVWWRRWSWQCMDRVTIAPRRCQPCHRCAMMHDKGWEGSNNDVIEIEAYHKIHEIYCNMPHRDVRSFLPKFAESVNLAFCSELWDVLNVLIND